LSAQVKEVRRTMNTRPLPSNPQSVTAHLIVRDAASAIADFGALAAASIGGSPIKLLVYVDDADAVVRQALTAGATELRPVKHQFHGDRSGMVLDPFGLSWSIATRVEDVSPDEMQRRFTAALAT
jgi:PhnB protein